MAALNVFISMLDEKDIQPLIKQFRVMDTNNTGQLSAENLITAMNKRGMKMSPEEVQKIIHNIDDTGNGMINYSEFLAASIPIKKFMTEEKLWLMFRHFDVEDTKFISQDTIGRAMNKLGKSMTAKDIQ